MSEEKTMSEAEQRSRELNKLVCDLDTGVRDIATILRPVILDPELMQVIDENVRDVVPEPDPNEVEEIDDTFLADCNELLPGELTPDAHRRISAAHEEQAKLDAERPWISDLALPQHKSRTLAIVRRQISDMAERLPVLVTRDLVARMVTIPQPGFIDIYSIRRFLEQPGNETHAGVENLIEQLRTLARLAYEALSEPAPVASMENKVPPETQVPLKPQHIKILKILAASPGNVLQADLVEKSGFSQRAIVEYLRFLRENKLTDRPAGDRSGECITEAGRARIKS